MASHNPFNDMRSQPPGTTELLGGHNAGGDGKVVLNPVPSDDPNDPLSWPMWRKCLNYGLLTAMTTAIFTALGVQPIFWPQMVKDMDVTLQDLTSGQAVQLVGLALGCVFFIPFAKKYGRRPVYILSSAFISVAIWWTAFMKTGLEVYLTNILLGLAGAVNETAVQMSIRDMFFVNQRGSANGIYLGAVTAGSFLTPMAAGAQAESSGWRSSYMTLAAFMSGLTLVFIGAFEETKFVPVPSAAAPNTLDDAASIREPLRMDTRSKANMANVAAVEDVRRPAPEDGGVRAPPPKRGMRLQLCTRTDESIWRTMYQPIHVVWFPHVVFTYLEFAPGICWFVVISSIVSIVFSKPPYNFNSAQIGYMSAGPFIGSVFGSLYGGYVVDKAIVLFARRNGGIFEPEMRLWLMPLAAVTMSAGLAIFGITADRDMHFIFPSIGSGLYAFGFGAISDSSFTLVIDSFPNLVAQTFVVIAFFRNAISIAGPFSITPWLDAMSVTSMFTIAASISVGIHLLAIPLVIWGKRARASIAPRYYRLSEKMS